MVSGEGESKSLASERKPIVSKEATFDLLEIRIGRVVSAVYLASPKPSYIIRADFGKFGVKQTVGRFTSHAVDELVRKEILGILNFEPREIAGELSEFLCLGVQFPKTDSGEATIVTPLAPAKIGGKVF